MLARAPGDLTRANAAQLKRSPSPGRTPHPAWGNGAVCPARRGANAWRTSECTRRTARRSASGAPRGYDSAAGQLTERRADCAADSAHIWSTWPASMVDLSARTRPVRRASRSQISQRSRKDRPHHRVDVVPIEPWPPPAVPSGIAVRAGAPRASVRSRRRQAGSIAWRPGRGRGWSLAGSPRPNRAGPGAIWHICWAGTAGFCAVSREGPP
jgi:hypothetical protein